MADRFDEMLTCLPKPYYSEPGIAIFHADCREILPLIPAKSVELVLTDPPYGIEFDYGTGYDDSTDEYPKLLVLLKAEAERVAQDWAIFQSAKNADRYSAWFGAGWRLISLPKLFTQIRRIRVQFSCDYLIWKTSDGSRKWEPEFTSRDFFVSSDVCITHGFGSRVDHPCPRPLDSMKYLVSILCPPSGEILDPFMGSGTTGRACKDLGRKFIGIEIEQKYCQIAVDRLRQEVLSLSCEG